MIGGSRSKSVARLQVMPIKTLTMRLAVPVRGYNSRMEVVLNGESCRDCVGLTVDQLLKREGFNGRRIAVEINREILPRSRYDQYQLCPGDQIEIVHAIGGG